MTPAHGATDPAATLPRDILFTDLLPVGTVLCENRIIVATNPCFADLFGYARAELLGVSLERLYPSFREFVSRGDEWDDYMRGAGQHCDERWMRHRNDDAIWMRVKGRCLDRADPYRVIACTFEVAEPTSRCVADLTRREREIVDAMCDGLTSKQIARRLDLSHRTIETYKARLMAKTGARNATQLMALIR